MTRRIPLAAALLAIAACDAPPPDERVVGEAPPDSEWVATDPAEPAVPVDVPEVEMTNVPAETPAASPAP